MVNKVILLGRLGVDPTLKMLPGGKTSVVNFTMATSRRVKKNDQWVEETDWHKVVVWGKQAEHCDKYLSKGSQVYIEGRLQTRDFEDKLGQKRYITEVVASNVQFLGAKNDSNKSSGNNYDDWSASKHKTPETIDEMHAALDGASHTFTSEDIPF